MMRVLKEDGENFPVCPVKPNLNLKTFSSFSSLSRNGGIINSAVLQSAQPTPVLNNAAIPFSFFLVQTASLVVVPL